MADDQYLKSMEDNKILGPFITDHKGPVKTMADHLKEISSSSKSSKSSPNVKISSLLYATLASIAIVGPLLGIMNFTLFTTIIGLIMTFPLLLISSPVWVIGGFVLGFVMVGFLVAGLMGLVGLHMFVWSYGLVRERRTRNGEKSNVGRENNKEVLNEITESGQIVKEQKGDEFGGYFQHKIQVYSPSVSLLDSNNHDQNKNRVTTKTG